MGRHSEKGVGDFSRSISGLNMKPELSKLLLLTEHLYRAPGSIEPESYDESKLFALAKLNRVLFYILTRGGMGAGIFKSCSKEADIVIKQGRDYLSKFKNTLVNLENILGQGNYVVFKTLYHYPRITNDIDIIVTDFDLAVERLRQEGWGSKQFLHANIHFTREGCLKLGVHSRIGWGTRAFMDEEIMWQNPQEVSLEGHDVQVPNPEVNLMAILAHIPFEKCYFDLGELLYIYSIAGKTDWNSIHFQAKKHHWLHAFLNTIGLINGLHREIYQKESPIESAIEVIRPVKIELPYEFPFWLAIMAHIEKREWYKLFSSLYGFQIIPYLAGRRSRKTPL